jgi:glutamate/tyrosine decarboxylase-like PLP-dependent enzyme
VREHVRLAALFADWIREDKRFEIMAPVQLSLVCFRLNPGGMNEEQLTKLNQELLHKINSNGDVFMTHTSLKGKYTIRLALGSRTTEERHVKKAWEIVQQAADEIFTNSRWL